MEIEIREPKKILIDLASSFESMLRQKILT